MIQTLRVGAGLLALALVTLLLLPLQILALRFDRPLARRLPCLWHRAACALFGLRVVVRGAPARDRPLLLVANHQSWADIMALGSAVEGAFVAKSEVRRWPVFGVLARLQRTIFVDRRRRGGVNAEAGSIGRRLGAGDIVVLFAEGTTSDGNAVLPFKSALFAAAQGAAREAGTPVLVQPVAIAWARLHGLPLGHTGRPLAAWTGDLDLLPHLWRFLRLGAFDAEIVFGAPIAFDERGDRKIVAARAREAVQRQLLLALRPQSPPGG